MKCIIYQIRNKLSEKIYIGSTNNFKKRINQHLHCLRNKKHHSIKLQNAWNKYGEENFKFEILEECNVEKIKDQYDLEQNYIDKLNCFDKGYNMSGSSYSPGGFIIWTELMRKDMGEKISRKHKGKIPKNISLLREKGKRAILEYENGFFIREYESAKQCGELLNIDYKLINNILRGKVKACRKYPNKTWKYKDNKDVRKLKYNFNSNFKKGNFKKIGLYINNVLVRTFFNSKEAAEYSNLTEESIRRICRGQFKKNRKEIYKYEN